MIQRQLKHGGQGAVGKIGFPTIVFRIHDWTHGDSVIVVKVELPDPESVGLVPVVIHVGELLEPEGEVGSEDQRVQSSHQENQVCAQVQAKHVLRFCRWRGRADRGGSLFIITFIARHLEG